MKITKFVHSCLMVEMPEPVNRTVIFDPGEFSRGALDVGKLEFLDDIIVTHNHFDHMNIPLIKELTAKFPKVRVTVPPDAVQQLAAAGITAQTEPSEGIVLFDSPHAPLEPLGKAPDEIGVHYLDKLTHPGDSHTFGETKAVLALPVTAPWGHMMAAAGVGLKLKPKFIIPIHDWHWNADARESAYNSLEQFFGGHGITFIKPKDGEPFVLDV